MRARAWAWWLGLLGAVAGARELDPAACAARFDVQRDKIIRTEESREMGARYLSELDVGARAECLRLCCETDSCDVFVYEEKGPGSCYLFDCGPPEDFRCKFTSHGNFSSGVLALSRRLAELQDQELRAHREQELANLRSATSTTPSPSTSTAPPPAAAPAPPPPSPSAAPRCSRYQFACRRGGECVAVYNACDGVPQCADGSDEAPELGCPPPPARPAPSPRPTPPFNTESGESEPAAEHWPRRLAQAQPPRRYGAESATGGAAPHIFSHKGGLVQETEGGGYPALEPWPRRAWPAAPPPPPAAPAPQPGMELAAWGGYARDWEAESRRAWPVPPRAEPELPAYIPAKAMPEVAAPYPGVQHTLRDSPKKAPPPPPDLREEPSPPATPRFVHDEPDKIKTAPPAPRLVGAAEAAPRAAAPPAAGAGAGSEGEGGRSERPPAAVLLLVLGVALTAALGALLACRARAQARRRRGKLAHDADYLVNGMYL